MRTRSFRLLLAATVFWAAHPTAGYPITVEFSFRDRSQNVSLELPLAETVGSLTLRALAELKAAGKITDYEAYEAGVISISGYANPVELPTPTTVKAYGWCFWLDGVLLESTTDATPLESKHRLLQWAWAYALYENGEWTRYCVAESPSFKPRAPEALTLN